MLSAKRVQRESNVHVTVRTGQDLKWDYTVNLIGRGVQDPLMHICEICSLPILIYGRMVSDGIDMFRAIIIIATLTCTHTSQSLCINTHTLTPIEALSACLLS